MTMQFHHYGNAVTQVLPFVSPYFSCKCATITIWNIMWLIFKFNCTRFRKCKYWADNCVTHIFYHLYSQSLYIQDKSWYNNSALLLDCVVPCPSCQNILETESMTSSQMGEHQWGGCGTKGTAKWQCTVPYQMMLAKIVPANFKVCHKLAYREWI